MSTAQNDINGTVKSVLTLKPIEYASVYIDGTSNATITDSNGYFVLKSISYPCRIVVSCVGYKLESMLINKKSDSLINVCLNDRTENLSEISVGGKNRRKQNLALFRNYFLGDDRWGKHAKLDKDEGLLFEHSDDTIHYKQTKKGVEYVHTFQVKTKSSVVAKLPLLGYDAFIDLESFQVKTHTNGQTTGYDMYTRFSPYEFTTEKNRSMIENNRREVYYNSAIYFCRSLFNNQLKQSGFYLYLPNLNIGQKDAINAEFDIAPYVVKHSESEIAIVGLKGKTLNLSYFYKHRNIPVDLTPFPVVSGKPSFPLFSFINERSSYVTFLSNDCVVYRNGVVGDNNIVFSGDMATCVGSQLLPLDYDPIKTHQEVNSVPVFDTMKLNSPEKNTVKAALPAFSQKTISEYFQRFEKDYPQEKVYLHFDNTAYYLGETIWFKAYVVRSDRHVLTNLSRVLYVEIYNAEGHLLDSRKLKIEDGQCHGEFKLNPTQYGGYYEVRAYTRYMLNFGDGNFFSRVFPVYDKPQKENEYKTVITERAASQRIEQKRPEYKQNGKLQISFYPEGGNLVNGISSKVAFRATNDLGEEVPVAGTIYKNKKDSVCSFATLYQGMGSFELCPDTCSYTALANWQGKTYNFQLPTALRTGVTMSVDNSDSDFVYMSIAKSPHSSPISLGLTISSRGVLYGYDLLNIKNDSTIYLNFPKRKLPSGVTQITLSDADGRVLSERLIFINHHSELKMTCRQSKSQYQPFEPVSLDFHLQDKMNKPIATTFSLSVRDAGTCSTLSQADNVLTDLLLSSELKGYIAHPGYYFESKDDRHQAALDLLLMVQGWSRYNWKQMAGVEKIEQKQLLEDGLNMDGSVVSLFLNKPKRDMNLSMILLGDSTSQQGSCKTDSAGCFNFSLRDFSGTARLILQTKEGDKKKETYIKLNRQFSPPLKAYSFAEQNEKQVYRLIKDSTVVIDTLSDGFDNELKRLLPKNSSGLSMTQRQNLLKQVTVKAKRAPVKVSATYAVEKEIDRRIDDGEWLPADLATLLNSTCKYFTKNEDAQGSEVFDKYKGKNVLFVVENSKLIVSGANEILAGAEMENPFSTDIKLSADNSQVNKEHKWSMPDLNEIESVTFIEDFATIFRLYSGTILDPSSVCICLIKLKKNYVREPYSMRNTKFDGYSVSRTFFSPQYDKVLLPNEKDYRRTLYWNPDVKTDVAGNATVQFYNNGSCKSMLINAETVTETGIIGVMSK